MKKSQKQQILDYLKRGGKINKLDAFNMFGCMTLAQRIADLKHDGHKIDDERDPEHKNASVYYIVDQLELL